MTPGARVSAAISILDNYLVGTPENKALINWFRGNRFAGSKDRRAIREIFFKCLRFKMSSLWPFEKAGFPQRGRYLVIGMLLISREQLNKIFDDKKYSPESFSEDEKTVINSFTEILLQAPLSIKFDFPRFLENDLKESFGDSLVENLKSLNERASLFLRVNLIKGTNESVIKSLKEEEIKVEIVRKSTSGLKVLENAKAVNKSQPYLRGEVEIQDISSQAAVNFINPKKGIKILDFCAGGGGKTLAMASLTLAEGEFFVYDTIPSRMIELFKRCGRAGFKAQLLKTNILESTNQLFDLVVIDVPCSGTGAWRRNPGSKWWLTQEKLDELLIDQRNILLTASKYVKNGGVFAYLTCSVLNKENRGQIDWFLSTNADFWLEKDLLISPFQGGDGFYVSLLKRISN